MSGKGDKEGGSRGELVVERKGGAEEAQFDRELGRSLDETEQGVAKALRGDTRAIQSWHQARASIESFRPVPWFIWRLSNFVFSKSGQINVISEGMVLGLRRLLFAAASDPILGIGEPVNNVKVAISHLRSDVIAAVAVIHGVCRRLATKDYQRIWRPILDDAVLRAQIGFFVGERQHAFGSGRGMLAGFAGRAGLAVMIANGTEAQARQALEKLASGDDIGEVGLDVYGCDPLQLSAMILSAAGCGRDAAFGTVSFATKGSVAVTENQDQALWLAAFSVCELTRSGNSEDIPEDTWSLLHYKDEAERIQLAEMAQILTRQGTSWGWLM